MAQMEDVDVFDFDTSELESGPAVKGSFQKLLLDIEAGIVKRTKWEWNRADKSKPMLPLTVFGKPVLPRSAECFVVRVTNKDRERVCLLYNWNDLYNSAFYVQSPIKAKRCWYYFKDYEKTILSMLPPRHQFDYIPVTGQGLYKLPVSSNYAGVGTKEIFLGPAIDGYVHQLFTIRENSRRVGTKWNIDKALRERLQNGPFSFGVVAISEPTRFADYQVFMRNNIFKSRSVPMRYTQFFTSWGSLCDALHQGKAYTLVVVNGEDVHLTVAEVREKIAVLVTGAYLLPEEV